jgi:PadR family transcriptional regulator AphA
VTSQVTTQLRNKRLAAAGLAEGEKEMTGARPRTVYRITRAGRAALRRWLDEPPEPPTLEFEGMVKVFFADAGSLEQLRAPSRRSPPTPRSAWPSSR